MAGAFSAELLVENSKSLTAPGMSLSVEGVRIAELTIYCPEKERGNSAAQLPKFSHFDPRHPYDFLLKKKSSLTINFPSKF